MVTSSSPLPSKSSSRNLLLASLSSPFLLSLLVRLPLALLQRTPFQPDETYQSLEPAHRIVFGYGHLTWEWQPNEAVEGVWWGWMAEGRLRGSAWVGLWAAVYWVVKTLRIESWALTIAPKIVMALIASLCDSSTYQLARRIFGPSVAPTALLLSLTSLFHAYALTRAFTNSFETSLTIFALTWWPLPSDTVVSSTARSTSTWSERSSTRIALLIAAITFTIRPTNLVLWIFLGAHLVYSRWTSSRRVEARQVVFDAFWIGLLTLLPSTLLDTLLFPPPPNSTLPFTFPLLPFLTYNLLLPTSLFYGSNSWHYYLLQALPILLLPSLPLALPAFVDAARGKLGRDARVLAGVIAWGVGVYSLIGHKEWRFCHPIVPVWNVLTAGWLMKGGKEEWIAGGGGDGEKKRKGVRLPKKSWTLLLIFVPLGPVIYLSRFHGVAQHGVIDWLREAGEEVKSVGVLMPCHSTPWQSHLHREDLDEKSWFLTCDPPKSVTSSPSTPHRTPESIFYSSPLRYLRLNFPSTYSPPDKSFASLQRLVPTLRRWPSHLVLFGALLEGTEGKEVEKLLRGRGYEEVWRGWNGFDVLQDDERRRGGVKVWGHVESSRDQEQ